MALTASPEAPKFENDWLQSPLEQLTPFSTWSVCVVLVAIVLIGKSLVFIFSEKKLASPNYGNKSST